jgi:hypothetical protein
VRINEGANTFTSGFQRIDERDDWLVQKFPNPPNNKAELLYD